jgi:hypothetical protein
MGFGFQGHRNPAEFAGIGEGETLSLPALIHIGDRGGWGNLSRPS